MVEHIPCVREPAKASRPLLALLTSTKTLMIDCRLSFLAALAGKRTGYGAILTDELAGTTTEH